MSRQRMKDTARVTDFNPKPALLVAVAAPDAKTARLLTSRLGMILDRDEAEEIIIVSESYDGSTLDQLFDRGADVVIHAPLNDVVTIYRRATARFNTPIWSGVVGAARC